ncbi:protein FAR1-RELATED SEQUENCE 5-like [Salvia splendens]|uniref:protein FAR1-RELATED SEQUENCE 5-like n=1 Tax=Salvia splendens TaxID=180675 RepID=UPI001C257549|nr:protein FAR1-RELATED SEQUENCE 5-like [Salvia splendens]
MLSSQRRITEVQAHEIDLADDIGLNQKSSFNLMSRQVGGRDGIGYTILDAKNYLRTERQRSMVYGEVGCLLKYFQDKLSKNPSFYHANQMDMEEHITNVFWADVRILTDYEYFGDVMSLDTTYCTNRDNRPLAVFSGFNHHRRAVIFGASLLYDETIASFKWLFETFLEAHKHKMPLIVFTDQDQAMAKALHEEGSCFLTDFKRCIYGFEDEAKFEEAWSNLLTQFNLHDNMWLKHMYSVKNEFILFAAAYIEHKDESGSLFEYVIRLINHDGEWRVTYDPSTKMIHCSCRRFEIIGLICCHSVKVFDVLDVKLLLENYILKRWTREARTSVVHDYVGNEVEENSEFQSVERYRRLCQMLIRLANEASVHQSTFSLVHETMPGLYKKVMEMCSKEDDQENRNNAKISSVVSHMMVSKAFKKKVGSKGSKRLKSWVELQPKRRKPNHKVQVVGAQNSLHIASPALPTSNACLERTGNYLSLTELLTHAHVSLIQLFDAALNGALEAHLASTIKIIEIHACTF